VLHFFFSSRRRHTRFSRDWSSDVCSSDLTFAKSLAQHQGAVMKVTIIDYGAGNVPSVERALHRLGAESERTGAPEHISRAEALLLPGVGHYSALVRALDEQKTRQPLVDAIQRGVPFLGICLGLQVLFESSAEAPQLRGLSLLPGKVC